MLKMKRPGQIFNKNDNNSDSKPQVISSKDGEIVGVRLPQSTIDARKKLREERSQLTAEDIAEQMRAERELKRHVPSFKMPSLFRKNR